VPDAVERPSPITAGTPIFAEARTGALICMMPAQPTARKRDNLAREATSQADLA
jgi:hypothetical protein